MNTIQPLLSFSLRRDECAGNVFFGRGKEENAVGTLASIQPHQGCIYGDGITSKSKVVSYYNVGSLKTLLGSNDFAIEMWLRPKLNVTTTETIFAIGKDLASSSVCRNNLAVWPFTATSSVQQPCYHSTNFVLAFPSEDVQPRHSW